MFRTANFKSALIVLMAVVGNQKFIMKCSTRGIHGTFCQELIVRHDNKTVSP